MQLTVYKDDKICFEVDLSTFNVHPKEGVVEFFIGRSDECHIELDDKKVSRIHSVIKLRPNGWFVENLSLASSLLGNGRPIQKEKEKELKNGDTLIIGPFTINIFIEEKKEEEMKHQLGLRMSEVLVDGGKTSSDSKINDKINERTGGEENHSLEEGTIGGLSIPDIDETQDAEEKKGDLAQETEEIAPPRDESDPFNEVSRDNDLALSEKENSSLNDPMSIAIDESNQDKNGHLTDSRTQIFNSFVNYKLKIFGEFSPYDSFVLNENEVFIGREGPKCKIILKDTEVSSVHAVIRKEGIKITLEDLNSTNGTVLNGLRINKAELVQGDEFVIGSTTFKLEIASDLLKSEEERLMPVDTMQEMEVEEIVEEEVDFGNSQNIGLEGLGAETNNSPKSNSLFSKDALKDPAKRKKILYALIGILLLYILLEPPEEEIKEGEKKETDKKELVAKGGDDGEKKEGEEGVINKEKSKVIRPLTKEEEQYVEQAYNLAKELFAQGRYEEAQREIDKVLSVSDVKYKESEQLKFAIAQGYKKIKDEEERKQKELEEQQRKIEIEKLLELAKDAVEKRKVELAEGLFAKILILDPEQSDVNLLKMDLDAWKEEEAKKKMEEERIKAERIAKVEKLRPGKEFYLQKKWYIAVDHLKKFLIVENMDEDLIKEASSMLEDSEKKLADEIAPFIGEARSLKEGQDLKGAYEAYKNVLKSWPNHPEASRELDGIKEDLDFRASKIYREAIISESLSLFKEAEDKFQEVLQIAPNDSDYYTKSKNRLKKIVR